MSFLTISNKKFLIFSLILFLVFLIWYPSTVNAGVIPTIRGHVYTETKRPIAGVWVAMTSSGCQWCPDCLKSKATRYAKTNDKGEFVFEPVYVANYLQPGGTCESNPAIGRMIDTDLDGVLDAEEIPKAPAGCTDNGAKACTYEFGCWGASYTFSVIKPFNWVGSFDELTKVDFNNAEIDFTIDPGEIIYRPSVVTPTPTPLPIYTIEGQEPPFPSCLTSTILQFGQGQVCREDQEGCKSKEDYVFNSIGGGGTLKIYTGMGHLWDMGCNSGPRNDVLRPEMRNICDQESQTYEAVKIILNGEEVGRTIDIGTDVNSYWEFPVLLNDGSNTLRIEHVIAGESLSIETESVFYKGVICAETAPPVAPLSCRVSLPSTISLYVNQTKQVLPLIEQQNGTVDEVTFSLEPLGYAYVCQSQRERCVSESYSYKDTSPVLSSNITGISNGSLSLSVSAKMVDEGVVCEPGTTLVQVFSPDPWLQVSRGNVLVNGDVNVQIPSGCALSSSCAPYFIKKKLNSLGIAFLSGYYNSNVNISEAGWLAEGLKNFDFVDFSFFESQVRSLYRINIFSSNITEADLIDSGVEKDGYYYYFYEGTNNLNIADDISLGSRKVVLFVKDASVFINGNVTLNDGSGFFMIVTNKDIYVSPDVYSGIENVPALEGIFVADGKFISQSAEDNSDRQLFIRGTVLASQFLLQRSLKDNSSSPSELFEFAPDLYMNYPVYLSRKPLVWKEVTP